MVKQEPICCLELVSFLAGQWLAGWSPPYSHTQLSDVAIFITLSRSQSVCHSVPLLFCKECSVIIITHREIFYHSVPSPRFYKWPLSLLFHFCRLDATQQFSPFFTPLSRPHKHTPQIIASISPLSFYLISCYLFIHPQRGGVSTGQVRDRGRRKIEPLKIHTISKSSFIILNSCNTECGECLNAGSTWWRWWWWWLFNPPATLGRYNLSVLGWFYYHQCFMRWNHYIH